MRCWRRPPSLIAAAPMGASYACAAAPMPACLPTSPPHPTPAGQELLTKAPQVESSLEASQIQGKLSAEETQVGGRWVGALPAGAAWRSVGGQAEHGGRPGGWVGVLAGGGRIGLGGRRAAAGGAVWASGWNASVAPCGQVVK